MGRNVRLDGTDGQQSLGELVALAAKDISTLFRYEITLAKRELKVDVRRILLAAALAVFALSGLCLILILLCFALAYLIVWVTGWPTFVAFLLTAAGCLLVIVLAGWIALGRIKKVTGMKMTRKTVMDDISMLRRSEPSPDGLGPGADSPEVGTRTGTGLPPGRP
ncbi:MAG TPA: phage holin family protein [Trebonia sp.]|nr:phage holin family protein [Trebonia sp.]